MLPFLRWRSRLVADLAGDILEIGVGTGPNLPLYRRATHVHGIEPDPARAADARAAAQRAQVPVTIDVAPAEELPYADNSFDHVVSSLVLCSVQDQHRVLQELRRVLKPDGTLHLVEHVRPETSLLADLFRILTPWWRGIACIACNCHLDRPTIAVLTEMGWDVQVHKRFFMFVRMSATPAPAPRFGALSAGSNTEFYQ
jgi:ubiquinone/menaquinone biosynthesis C-methylase UbiE